MTDLERDGSFLREPAISEEAIANKLDELTEAVRPNANSRIERGFSLAQDSPFESRELYRAKQALGAALRHDIGDDMTVTFALNETWNTADPQEVILSLTGTEVVKGHLRFDAASGRFDGFLEDADGSILPRDEVAPEVISEALASFGVYPSLDFSTQQGLSAWLQPQSFRETRQHVLQRHILHHIEGESDDDMSGVYELEKEQIFSPDEVGSYIRFIETTFVGENKFARVVELAQSEHGSSLSVQEMAGNDETGEVTSSNRELDYELIEKILKHLEIAELHATR